MEPTPEAPHNKSPASKRLELRVPVVAGWELVESVNLRVIGVDLNREELATILIRRRRILEREAELLADEISKQSPSFRVALEPRGT